MESQFLRSIGVIFSVRTHCKILFSYSCISLQIVDHFQFSYIYSFGSASFDHVAIDHSQLYRPVPEGNQQWLTNQKVLFWIGQLATWSIGCHPTHSLWFVLIVFYVIASFPFSSIFYMQLFWHRYQPVAIYMKRKKKQDCQTYSSLLIVEFLFSTSSGEQNFFDDIDMIVTRFCVVVMFEIDQLRNLYAFSSYFSLRANPNALITILLERSN